MVFSTRCAGWCLGETGSRPCAHCAHLVLKIICSNIRSSAPEDGHKDARNMLSYWIINPLTPNDLHMSRTAPLTSKHCILYIYSTNVGTEYFKHALNAPFFSLQNALCFIMLTCLVPVSFTFYIQGVLKLKKNNCGVKGLINHNCCIWLVSHVISENNIFLIHVLFPTPSSHL